MTNSPPSASPHFPTTRHGSGMAAGAVLSMLWATSAFAQCDPRDAAVHHHLPAHIGTVQQGFFSKNLDPVISVQSGDFVTIEMVTHHADKDDRMMQGDEAIEGIFAERTRGHIMTGPIEVCGAEPGDVLEVRILDLFPRPSLHPDAYGRTYGANVITGGGFLYNPLVSTEESPVPGDITIYEVDASGVRNWAKADYSYPVDTGPEDSKGVLPGVRVQIRPHFGILAVAPAEADTVVSGPPAYFGGNIDDWRIGKGATMYYPVAVPGALLAAGDPHAAQGDSELSGTAIEMSLTGVVQLILHPAAENANKVFADLAYPLLETKDEFVIHGFSYPNYLSELGSGPEEAQEIMYGSSSLDQAMHDAATKMMGFLTGPMGLTHNEAYSLISVGVDFGVTQVVDGNWGIHATLRKAMMGETDVYGSLGAE